MTKRNNTDDEQVWFIVGDDGTFESLKKGRHGDFEEPSIEEEEDDEEKLQENLDVSDTVGNEIYIDPSQLVEEQENSEIDQEDGDGTDDDGTGGFAKVEEEPTSVPSEDDDPSSIAAIVMKWSDQATFRLLDLLDQFRSKDSDGPSKSDRIWIRIAQDMKPFYYTADECYKKFLYLKKTFRRALKRMENNQSYKWRYFNRMCRIMGESTKQSSTTSTKQSSTTSTKQSSTTSGTGVMEVQKNKNGSEASTSAAAATEGDAELGLSQFDRLLNHKKEVLAEVRRQGAIIEKHVEDCLVSTARREHRESEMIQLLQELRNQEQKKLNLFEKLLDKL